MNPREKARKVFEQQALAMRSNDDPIWPIVDAIQQARDHAFDEAIEVCRKAMDDGLEQSIQDYNAGCHDCVQGIMHLKGKITF